jgi:glycosyltransferase involved in cell wall biosynthesis
MVPNGVDRDYFTNLYTPENEQKRQKLREKWGITPEHQVIVYVGSVSLVSHAIDLLLEAFTAVLQKAPHALLLIVGGGEDLDNMKQLATTLNIQQAVRFVGQVPITDTPLFYQLGRISVDPRRDSVAAQSSLSLKLVESIAAGTPCITTDIGDRRALLRDAGAIVPPDDAPALATAILSFLQDEATLQQAQQAAAAMQNDLFWDSRVRTFATVYHL